jgi:AraC-like DNA-binding protein
VLTEAFETFPGALDPFALPAIVGGLSHAVAPLRSQDWPAASPRRQHCRKRGRAFLDTAIESSVTAEDLDRETGVDRFSLARSFRAQMGTTPHRHLIGRRLLRARAGIVGGLALAEAAAAGFADEDTRDC